MERKMKDLKIENLDHLGIVAGIVDELEIVNTINQTLGEDKREQVSSGVIVKALILNGLGFVSAPLYLFKEFYQGKATEHLLGRGITAEKLTDKKIGKVLDKLWEKGLTEIFLQIAMIAQKKYHIERKTMHADSTSFSVQGKYQQEEAEEGVIEITYGYSKDKRPDLKQYMMNLVCWGDDGVPAMMEMVNGNQADKARFGDLMEQFQQQWDFDGIYVADAALYSEENLKKLASMKWITRVPLSLKIAKDIVRKIDPQQFSSLNRVGYSSYEVEREYRGIKQRWIVIESKARKQVAQEKLQKKRIKVQQLAQKQLKKLLAQEFACSEDAQLAVERLSKELKYHQIASIEIKKIAHYSQPGKPKADALASHITYQPSGELVLDEQAWEQEKLAAGRFILATNILDSNELNAEECLTNYKAQQGNEDGFGFLKDRLFFTSSVFLKSPKRIMSVGLIMGLCLMVYKLGQRQLRQALRNNNASIEDQKGRPTKKPTLRWVFQCFMAVHYVLVEGHGMVVNLTDRRRQILKFLSHRCQYYYLL